MAGTPDRLLDLLALLQMPRAWGGAELASRLRATTRTVRNDVERLRLLGYRIDGIRGSAGGYRLAPGTKMPPLLLDDADVIVITASLLATQTGVLALISAACRDHEILRFDYAPLMSSRCPASRERRQS